MAKILPSSLLLPLALNPKTGRPFRSPQKKDVIYGFKTPEGKIVPLDMEPQKFTKIDFKQLSGLIKLNKLKSPPDVTFFVKRSNRIGKYKGGEKITERYFDEEKERYVIKTSKAKKGQIRYVYREGKKAYKAKTLKVVFKPPSYRIEKGKRKAPIYKKIIMKMSRGKYKQQTSDWRLQERDKFERVQDQIVASLSKLKKRELEGAAEGYKSKSIVLRGDTLASTISTIRPPHGYELLKRKGVTSIGMGVVVHFKDVGKWESFAFDIPAVELSAYPDLTNMVSREIRRELIGRGKTFTKLRTLEKIRLDIKKKAKANDEPYFPKWKKVGILQSGGDWYDFSAAINRMKRSGKSPYEEIKRGDLKITVTFRYYKGLEEIK